MKKPNLLILIIVFAVIAAVAVLAMVMPQTRTIPDDAAVLETVTVSEAPQADPSAAPQATQDPAAAVQPADAYLVVTVQNILYEPIPLAGEGSFTIKQDENTTNTIHVTADSVCMEHSTCDNQDCVDQGTVTLDNMKTRVLGNMIICLPNQVVLELHTPETLQSTFGVEF